MANATITVLEADGITSTDVVVLDVGRQAAAASKSVTTATEDKAVLDAIAASLALLDNSISAGNELQVDIVGALPAGTAAIGKVKVTNDAGTVIDPVAAGSAAMAASVPVTIATNDTQFTALLAALTVRTVQLVPTCDATACANLDVLAATEVLSTISRGNDIDCVLRSMTVTRLDSTTGLAMRIWFLKSSASVGAENAAFAPADGDADDLLFYIDTAAADFKGPTGMVNCFAQYMNLDYNVKVATGTDDCYIAIQCLEAIDIGAATDIVLTFGFM